MVIKTIFGALFGGVNSSHGHARSTPPPAPRRPRTIRKRFKETRGFEYRVKGVHAYEAEIRRHLPARDDDYVPHPFTATLRLENDNPHDPNAIAVMGTYGRVGYIAREDNEKMKKRAEAAGLDLHGHRIAAAAMYAAGSPVVRLKLDRRFLIV